MSASKANYCLYLVTDVTGPVLGSRDLADVVEQAVRSGVTMVQHRDKHGDTAEIIRTATRLMAITKRHDVPFIINDRVDIALAIDADGVHLGQTDMSLSTARRLLGSNKIIGITVNNADHVRSAVAGGADYVGIGTIFQTQTKTDTTCILGTAGLQELLHVLAECDPEQNTYAVAIGGLNARNVQALMASSAGSERRLDGIAVVSAIISAEDPARAATDLYGMLRETQLVDKRRLKKLRDFSDLSVLTELVPQVLHKLEKSNPLCHNMMNDVVKYFAANVALAIGASPIMSDNGLEAKDLAYHQGSLVVNIGSSRTGQAADFVMAVEEYNKASRPTLLDPVGAGATELRRETVAKLLRAGRWTVIKGNVAEIQALAGARPEQSQKGVDAGTTSLSEEKRAALVTHVARREKAVVVMTGQRDFVSDGHQTYRISNGHPLLSKITGSGCTLGTTIAACLAVQPSDPMLATVAGLLLFEIAAEEAARNLNSSKGPGFFVPAFVDQLHTLATQNDKKWLENARVELISN